jgi:sulfate permease, SulP family
VAVGATSLAVLLVLRWRPRRFPGPLVVVVAPGIGIVDPDAWRGLARTSRVEVAIAAVTTAGVILVGVLEALLVAVALSIVDVVRRSAIPHDAVLGWDERMGRYADVSVHRRARITPMPGTSPGASTRPSTATRPLPHHPGRRRGRRRPGARFTLGG